MPKNCNPHPRNAARRDDFRAHRTAHTAIPMIPSIAANTMINVRSFSIEVHTWQKALSKLECGPAIYKIEWTIY
jgi:hypothetical protein